MVPTLHLAVADALASPAGAFVYSAPTIEHAANAPALPRPPGVQVSGALVFMSDARVTLEA